MNTTNNEGWLRGSLVTIVIIHCIVALWHGANHLQIPVLLSDVQIAFIGIIILLLPLIGAGLLWTRLKVEAAWLIMLSMLASLLFGFINHFMIAGSSDYILAVPAHMDRYSFIVSAALLVLTETMGTVMGAVAIVAWRRSALAESSRFRVRQPGEA